MLRVFKLREFELTLLVLFSLFFINSLIVAQSPLDVSIQNALRGSSYIICIDGGGSKTELQVLDRYGELVSLKHDSICIYSIKSGGSNINVLGEGGVKNTLDALLGDLKIAKTNIDLKSIASQCAVIGGFSGAGRVEAQSIIKNLFKVYGFDENKIIITSDADMAIESVSGDGIILISGTGSICFGKKGADRFRVGGLGRLIGDEGSGYYIGIRALKAALEDEYGWGNATTLKKALRDYFDTSDLKTVVAPFYASKITSYQIAAIAPIVFDQVKNAEANDDIASGIINEAAQELGKMLSRMIRMGKFLACPIYFFGGIFKNENASLFIQKILKVADIEKWKTFNNSRVNPTVLAVQRLQKHI